MTLSQEQQPQERRGTGAVASSNQPLSRREARDAERRAQAQTTGDLSGLGPEHPSGAYELNESGNLWDSISRRAASQLTDAATEAERRTGRRVADADRGAAAPPEPQSYVTQGRPNIPSYDGPSFARRPQLPTAAQSEAGFRERSFAPQAPVSAAPSVPVAGLDYQTQTRTPPLRAAAPEPVVQEPASLSLDHTLTRRELREMRESGAMPSFTEADLAPRPGGWTPTPAASAAPPVGFREAAPATPVTGIPLGSAFAAYDNTATEPMSAVDRAELIADKPVAPTSFPPAAAGLQSFVAAQPRQKPAASEAPVAAAPTARVVQAPVAASDEDQDETEPAFSDAPITGLLGFEALIAQASAGLDAPSVPATGPQQIIQPEELSPRRAAVAPVAEQTFTPPTGHWSVQADRDDDELQPFDGLLSRSVGSAGGSTNALIMPNDPQPDLIHALNSTGEILVTGSLDLPRSLSSTGATSDHYDSSEIDRLFEASQEDQHTSDVAPVRAARAVSTHTSTRSVVSPRRRSGGALPVVLAVTAAIMALGVAGLLLGGLVLNLF